jgi:hypothetical protein
MKRQKPLMKRLLGLLQGYLSDGESGSGIFEDQGQDSLAHEFIVWKAD